MTEIIEEPSTNGLTITNCKVCGFPKTEDEYRVIRKHGRPKRRDNVCRECFNVKMRDRMRESRYNKPTGIKKLRKTSDTHFSLKRQSILVIYDIIRYSALNGGNPIEKHEFLDLLHRASCGRCSASKCEAKRNEILSRLISHRCGSGDHELGESESHLRMMLGIPSRDNRKCGASFISKDRAHERFKHYMRFMGIDVQTIFSHDIFTGVCISEILIKKPAHWMVVFERLLANPYKVNFKFRKRKFNLERRANITRPKGLGSGPGWKILFGYKEKKSSGCRTAMYTGLELKEDDNEN